MLSLRNSLLNSLLKAGTWYPRGYTLKKSSLIQLDCQLAGWNDDGKKLFRFISVVLEQLLASNRSFRGSTKMLKACTETSLKEAFQGLAATAQQYKRQCNSCNNPSRWLWIWSPQSRIERNASSGTSRLFQPWVLGSSSIAFKIFWQFIASSFFQGRLDDRQRNHDYYLY